MSKRGDDPADSNPTQSRDTAETMDRCPSCGHKPEDRSDRKLVICPRCDWVFRFAPSDGESEQEKWRREPRSALEREDSFEAIEEMAREYLELNQNLLTNLDSLLNAVQDDDLAAGPPDVELAVVPILLEKLESRDAAELVEKFVEKHRTREEQERVEPIHDGVALAAIHPVSYTTDRMTKLQRLLEKRGVSLSAEGLSWLVRRVAVKQDFDTFCDFLQSKIDASEDTADCEDYVRAFLNTYGADSGPRRWYLDHLLLSERVVTRREEVEDTIARVQEELELEAFEDQLLSEEPMVQERGEPSEEPRSDTAASDPSATGEGHQAPGGGAPLTATERGQPVSEASFWDNLNRGERLALVASGFVILGGLGPWINFIVTLYGFQGDGWFIAIPAAIAMGVLGFVEERNRRFRWGLLAAGVAAAFTVWKVYSLATLKTEIGGQEVAFGANVMSWGLPLALIASLAAVAGIVLGRPTVERLRG